MLRTRRTPAFPMAGLAAAVAAVAAVTGCSAPAAATDQPPGITAATASVLEAQPAPAPQLAALRRAMEQYGDPAAAVAAGYVPTEHCVESPPDGGGTGLHYANPALLSRPIDPTQPAILVYVPTDRGPQLGAVEWFQPDADQDPATDDDRPSLFNVPFDGPMAGHEPGMPIHYDLHAWLFEPNPVGLFAPWNPRVHC